MKAVCLRTREGGMMKVDYTLAPIRDDQSSTIGCVVIFRDNTTHLSAGESAPSA